MVVVQLKEMANPWQTIAALPHWIFDGHGERGRFRSSALLLKDEINKVSHVNIYQGSQKCKNWQFRLNCAVWDFWFVNIGGKRLGSVWFLAPFNFCSIRNAKISVNAAKSGKSDTDNQSDKGVGRGTRQLWAIAKTAILTKLRHFGGAVKKVGSDNSLVALCVI